MLSYFADDVALKLDSCHVFYTPNVGIRGVSSYEHNFDFLFQRSVNHPTRFCQAPNRFDKDAVKDIMFGWDDTKKDSGNGVTVHPLTAFQTRRACTRGTRRIRTISGNILMFAI